MFGFFGPDIQGEIFFRVVEVGRCGSEISWTNGVR